MSDIEDQEEGEILDDEDVLETPSISSEPLKAEEPISSDDESPAEILNEFTKKVEERRLQQLSESVEPHICRICKKNPHKYRCPRCDLRTCSLDCSKQHKVDNNCDGVRQLFTVVNKLSQFDGLKSIEDQKFMSELKEKVGLGAENANSGSTIGAVNLEAYQDTSKSEDPNALRFMPKSGLEKYLINAARFRRVWLGFTATEEANDSRHEQFSDTIFWTLQLIFRKQTAEGFEDYEKKVTNIPETIRLVTVLRQFFKPRKVGCIVSESDLDLTKLAPFNERGIENVNIMMPVHGIEDKYYGIVADSTILDNLRNRVVVNNPKLIITLNDEAFDMQLLSKEEIEEISLKFGGITQGNDRFHGGRVRGGSCRGIHRGGHGNGGHGFSSNNFNRKRQANNGHDQQWKRGRGGGGHRGQGRNFNRYGPPADSFDPFEPFEGPNRLPMEYGAGDKNN